MSPAERVSSIDIQAEHIRTMFRLLPVPIAGGSLVVTALVAILWNTAPHGTLLIWLGVFYGSMVIRWRMTRAYQRQPPAPEAARRWGLASAILAGVSGLIWGAAPILFLDPVQPVSLIAITTVLVGASGGALVFLSPYLPAYFSFTVPTLLSLATVWVLRGGPWVFRSPR